MGTRSRNSFPSSPKFTQKVDHKGNAFTSADGKRFWKAGTPLHPKDPRFRMALVSFKADLQFEKQVFGWQSYDKLELCRECCAHKKQPGLLYTELGPTARWRLHPRTQAAYLADRHRETYTPGVAIARWLSMFIIRFSSHGSALSEGNSCIAPMPSASVRGTPRILTPCRFLAWKDRAGNLPGFVDCPGLTTDGDKIWSAPSFAPRFVRSVHFGLALCAPSLSAG